MRSDLNDVTSLVSYINDIKPFHSKLTEVTVEYQTNDNMFVTMTDAEKMDMKFSSVWELRKVSDGKRTRYQIPAAVFPRYSEDYHQDIRVGVTDAVPGRPGVYLVPANDAIQVSVNGDLQVLNHHYTLNADRTEVTFKPLYTPTLNAKVQLNWTVSDRVFIGLGTSEIVWQQYTLSYLPQDAAYAIMPFDEQIFDDTNTEWTFNSDIPVDIFLSPIGYVRIVNNSKGQPYYVFDFIKAPSLNTNVWIRVEQREAYNGWTQTKFTETFEVKDLVSFSDSVNAWIVDPGTWKDNPGSNLDGYGYDVFPFDTSASTIFGIDINKDKTGYYDINDYDTVSYDSPSGEVTLGYYRLFNIHETNTTEVPDARVRDYLRIEVTESTGYDTELFDTTPYDTKTFVIGSYIPDGNGLIYVNDPMTTIEIVHDYGYNPIVTVYWDNHMLLPQSVVYPTVGVILVTLSAPRAVVIRLV